MAKTPKKIFLKIPAEIAEETNNLTRVVLHWTPYHPTVFSSAGVVVSRSNEILDGQSFRAMRDALGAWLDTAHPKTVCRALGLPIGEPGIGSATGSSASGSA